MPNNIKINIFIMYKHRKRMRTLYWFGLYSERGPPFNWELFCVPKPKGLDFCCCCDPKPEPEPDPNPKGFVLFCWWEPFCPPNPWTLGFLCWLLTCKYLHLSPYWQLKHELWQLKTHSQNFWWRKRTNKFNINNLKAYLIT